MKIHIYISLHSSPNSGVSRVGRMKLVDSIEKVKGRYAQPTVRQVKFKYKITKKQGGNISFFPPLYHEFVKNSRIRMNKRTE